MFEHLLNCHGEWTIFLGLLPSWALVPYWFKIGVYGTYCMPRISNADSYECVEVGFPSDIDPLLMPFCEDPKDPTETVYPYVPSTTIYLVIAKHGGMIQGELPPGIPCPKEWNCENR